MLRFRDTLLGRLDFTKRPIWLQKNGSIWKRRVLTQLLLIYSWLIKPKFTKVTFCRGAKYIVLNFKSSKVVSQLLGWDIESDVVLENDISGVRKQYDCRLACKPLLHLSINQFKEKISEGNVDWAQKIQTANLVGLFWQQAGCLIPLNGILIYFV